MRFCVALRTDNTEAGPNKGTQKSDEEIFACPYNCLTTPYFHLRFPHRFLAEGNKNQVLCSSSRNLGGNLMRKWRFDPTNA